eukprot:GHVP01039536.1.p1 GENE.GHVP01039536.1~~GHVP01039536.1.p1  ORF type:complete len:643 (-),score=97.34 GHVP01039536.1:1091-3019(-)
MRVLNRRILVFYVIIIIAIFFAKKRFKSKDSGCVDALKEGDYDECLIRRNKKPDMFCYVSLLCDDIMIDAALTMLLSFQKTSSRFPFVMLVLPEVTEIDELTSLGARIVKISPLEYPAMFRITKEKKMINKMCRYSKLHIWRLTEFKKAIFVDIDTLFRKNTDVVFTKDEISAVSDLGDTFNTGFFLFRPSIKTYNQMVAGYRTTDSYNQSDQGFINTFFSKRKSERLPIEFNVMCKAKEIALWEVMRKEARLFHYTSETKPWNFHYLGHPSLKENFEIEFYYEWFSMFHEMQRILIRGVFSDLGPIWESYDRRCSVCDEEIKGSGIRSKKYILSHFSIVLFKWETSATLDAALTSLRIIAPHIIDKIYVKWESTVEIPFYIVKKYERLSTMGRLPSVIFVRTKGRSENHHFYPIPGVRTKGLFYTTDKFIPDTDWLELAYKTWCKNEKALVGAHPQYHVKKEIEENIKKDKTKLEEVTISYGVYNPKTPRSYSMLSMIGMFIATEYLLIYSCLLPLEIHLLVDRGGDGADIAMNMLVAGMTGLRPLFVSIHGGGRGVLPKGTARETIDEYKGIENYTMDPQYIGQYSSIPDISFHQKRARIIRELFYLFGNKDVLQYNNSTIMQYTKIAFKKKSPKQWHKK